MSVDFAALLKEIGRGKRAARALSLEQATALGQALAENTVPDGVLGALLLAFRMKGETAVELIGLQAGLQTALARLHCPAEQAPLVIPSYNGARRTANLVPLLALMLRALEIPVLLHGPRAVAGRTATVTLLERLGVFPSESLAAASEALSRKQLAYLPIEILAPAHARLLAWRTTLGVRNFAHTLVKLIEPFNDPTTRLISITHPVYQELMRECLTTTCGSAVLMRGHEGEPVAHPNRLPAMLWIRDGVEQILPSAEEGTDGNTTFSPLPELDLEATADWTARVITEPGRFVLPRPLLEQVSRLVWTRQRQPSLNLARHHVFTYFGQRPVIST